MNTLIHIIALDALAAMVTIKRDNFKTNRAGIEHFLQDFKCAQRRLRSDCTHLRSLI